MGQMAMANDELDIDTAQLIAETEFEIVNKTFVADPCPGREADDVEGEIRPRNHRQGRRPRKTTLLPIRAPTSPRARLAASPAHGATRYAEEQIVTFIDTTGHAAFAEMRSRSTGDGHRRAGRRCRRRHHARPSRPSISKAAGVQIIVAVNKCDKPGVDPTSSPGAHGARAGA